MNPRVEFFTVGKNVERNEDVFSYNDHRFVIADGSTDKSGRSYGGKTGGELVSQLIVNRALETELVGQVVVEDLNHHVAQLYKELDITKDITDSKYRFASTFILVHIDGDSLCVTSVGDSGFRVNGNEVHQHFKKVDEINAEERAKFFRERNLAADVSESLQREAREHIMPLLVAQFAYQNNDIEELGYGAIDGTTTPKKFIQEFTFLRKEVETIELFTDGYPVIPTSGVSVTCWEDAYATANAEDPFRHKKYKSTKSKDDRTIAIIHF